MVDTSELLKKYGKLSECWVAALNRLGHVPHEISFAAWQSRINDGQGPVNVTHQIGVLKHHGEWKICYAAVRDDAEDVACWIPIVDAPVAVRVRAASHFKELQAVVAAARETWDASVDAAIRLLK
jgi:hypothetical protein